MAGKVLFRMTKIYADGHLWTENLDDVPDVPVDEIYKEDPSLVALVFTRQVRRSGEPHS